MENTNNQFIRLMPYLGKTNVMDKAKLLKDFESFLDDPEMNGGAFLVYWIENEYLINTMSPEELLENVKQHLKN